MKISRLAAFFLLLLILVPGVFAQTGGTESGTTTEAVEGPALKLDTPVTVQLDGLTPVNLSYKSTGGETDSVSARSLEAEDILDPTLVIFDIDGAIVAQNDDHQTNRAGLNPRDSLIDSVTFTNAGRYTIQVAGTDANASGRVEIVISSASGDKSGGTRAQTQDQTQAQGANLNISDTVPPDSPYTTTFQASQGDVLTITVKAADNQLDPKVSLLDSTGAEVASNDDHESTDSALGPYDSQIPNFTIPKTDTYTISISGFAGIGGKFDLTVAPSNGTSINNTNPTPGPIVPTEVNPEGAQVIQGTVAAGETYTYDLQVTAGDVYTITVQSKTENFDPKVAIYLDNDYIIDNDDFGSSDPNLKSTDARIYNWIFDKDGKYELDVSGYQNSAGDFTLTLDRVATGAPYGKPVDQVELGSIAAGETYSYTFDVSEGDWVTITVRTLTDGFDPYLTLLDQDGTVLLNNDDNGSSFGEYAYYDSLIRNYYVPANGSYTVEVTGVSDGGGSFGVTIGKRSPG
jgi:Bacterial pre-peptidase C-terminal domain